MTQKHCTILAGLNGAFVIIVGAFGAHGLKDIIAPELLETYHTGVLYHLIHAPALLALAFAPSAVWSSKWAPRIVYMWIAGIALFSGSLYVLALTRIGILGAITPFGGTALIIGWLMVLGLRNVND
jgi:uncharacterized membrane protein YgdD (TMEM256/DUF423 family)